MEIPLSENSLYFRAVNKLNWDAVSNKPSTSAFKNAAGVSVDEQGGPSFEEIKILFVKKFTDLFVIACIDKENCAIKEIKFIAEPLPDNPYHGNLIRFDGNKKLTYSQMLHLKNCCSLLFP